MKNNNMKEAPCGENKPIRILQVLPTLNICGGVENYLMNYYTRMDLSAVTVDFAVHDVRDSYFKDMIESRGGRVYGLPKFTLKNYAAIKRQIVDIFESTPYSIVHCHQANAAFLYLRLAEKYGVPHRILHSHQAAAADKFTHAVRNMPLLFIGKKYANMNFACSRLAGEYLFKKKPFTVIKNAVDIEKFSYSEAFRAEIRARYGLSDDAFIIGNIGRFCPQKNQEFALRVFAACFRRQPNAYFFLIGEGELSDSLQKFAKDNGLTERVVFVGKTTEIQKFYSAMDVFLLPSLYEGLPVSGVEAQVAGLPIVTSDTVTEELALLPSTLFLSLEDSIDFWSETVLRFASEKRIGGVEIMKKAGYDITEEVKKLEELYYNCF